MAGEVAHPNSRIRILVFLVATVSCPMHRLLSAALARCSECAVQHRLPALRLASPPRRSRILACTATNKAIDSLVAKLEAAGLTQMLCVGSRRAMGEASCRYLMSSVLARDGFVAAAETAIEQHSANVRRIEAELRELPVPDAALLKAGGGKSGGGGGGGGGGRGGRRGKAKGRGGEAGGGGGEAAPNGGGGEGDGSDGGDAGGDCGGGDEDGAAAAAAAAAAPPPDPAAVAEAKKLEARRAEVKKRLKAEQESVRRHTQTMGERKGSTRRQVWKEVRLVACTASAALQVTRRLQRDMEEGAGSAEKAWATAEPLVHSALGGQGECAHD